MAGRAYIRARAHRGPFGPLAGCGRPFFLGHLGHVAKVLVSLRTWGGPLPKSFWATPEGCRSLVDAMNRRPWPPLPPLTELFGEPASSLRVNPGIPLVPRPLPGWRLRSRWGSTFAWPLGVLCWERDR